MSALFPTKSLLLLILIGLIDLISTAILHKCGLIVEMNPLMRVFIERSEWGFAAVKALTLVAAWYVMSRYAKHNRPFVRSACLWGSAAYVTIWLSWFMGGHS